ncbi:4-hydroxy-tetrahydrodipicolinate reductase,chloroplastic [Raphidocelis subcapitata]|uniref:4-hydroxy-tetrahydrodipicolinate reductase n=1 Tax=Raphidocelis subcapitata TaxID=307507 RepID=A0A2V0NL42_9CHLO|nr:4-hydroxy-tetrahydrodipicolinate reductase,chloroplastic [Raphidocelis subcapitata]|eukprot:GBF87779.1 4-hydroxy-tetrahydrodipicolinate reductase,chloroplastic [Raphidocelis subcapitata]
MRTAACRGQQQQLWASRGAAAAGPRRAAAPPLRPPRRARPGPPAALAVDAAAAAAAAAAGLAPGLRPPVMINSCTGRMGHAAAEAMVRAGLQLVPFTLTGYSAGVAVSNIGVSGVPVELVGKERRQEAMDRVKERYPGLIVVDYTLPNCVNDNAEFYARNGVPFVMGTTGGDREKVVDAAQAAGVYAVVAPQMGKQVVAFQAMMDMMADSFPGVFSGYKLRAVESHRRGKPDVSGTAKAVVGSLKRMGVAEFKDSDIVKVRDREGQLRMAVPEEHLDGHAFHTYTLTSPDGSVEFVFKHNVVERTIYAEGTVDAVLFLAKKRTEGAKQRVYSMVDVLLEGSLR